MKKILELLNSRIITDREYAKKAIRHYVALHTAFTRTPNINYDVKESEVNSFLKVGSSMTLQDIIVIMEKLNRKKLYDKEGHFVEGPYASVKRWDGQEISFNLLIESFPSYRKNVSLVEIIAGKLFPKGRCWSSGFFCKNLKGYNEALKKAKKFTSSYSRTMRNLVTWNLINAFFAPANAKQKRYLITEKGKTCCLS